MKNAQRVCATALADSRNPTPPEDPITHPGRALLIKAHKQSQRARWSDHFTLQLRANGFRVMTAAEYASIADHDHNRSAKCVVSEFRFHPERLWRFDFAMPALKIAVEIEGGIWMKGGTGHSHPIGISRDIEKGNAAVLEGWRVLRFTDKEIRAGQSIDLFLQLTTR